ncbi:MAG: SDR family NAD(P)-dependent oxidoreductase [Planctomycetota bacterium]
MNLSQRLANLTPKQRAALQSRLQGKATAAEPIAVVGMGCRFPGAPDLDAYWSLIREGTDGTSDIPAERFDVDPIYDPDGIQAGKMSVRRAGLVDGIDLFDPQFFGISPREAARMDPQQRLLLEVAWESLEIGGIGPHRIAGENVGVYVGIGGTDYSKVPSQYDGYYQYIDAHIGTGNALSIAANRISYIMDLRGPSMAIDTACSSSTMATHLAVESLRRRECEMALAGGVNAILTPETTIAFSKARMLSPDGRCRPFDASANGYVRGEGCGIVVLKRLSRAIADGNQIFGIIRATATNQDGRTNGITAPNGVSQQAVIRTALSQAGLDSTRIDYIEAHGTGTPLGDPIEMDALSKIFRRESERDQPLYVTSVKANVGHMETVSGIAGLIKVLLLMRYQHIAPQLHLQTLNPRINTQGSRLTIPTSSPPWPASGRSFIAGISSFGFGGANTHIIVESPTPEVLTQFDSASKPLDTKTPAPDSANGAASSAGSTLDSDQRPARPTHALTLSAKTESALAAMTTRLREFAVANPTAKPENIAFTCNTGRAPMPYRAAVTFPTGDDPSHLLKQLEALESSKAGPGIHRGIVEGRTAPRLAMLFTGQGSQRINMAKSLMTTQPVFRSALEQCEEILNPLLPMPLSSVVFPSQDNGTSDNPINETLYTQPALFAIEYALAQLWKSWGVRPSVVLGHSVGQYVAMCVAGCISLEDGLRLIAARGAGMQSLPAGGRMVVVMASAERVSDVLHASANNGSVQGEPIAIAAANGPENTTVSGSADAIAAFTRRCDSAQLAWQPLKVSHAFHSPLMRPMIEEFIAIASECHFHKPKIPLISNVDGQFLTRAPNVDDLCEHILGTVRFADSIETLRQKGVDAILEVGPSPVLIGMGKRCWPSGLDESDRPAWIPSLRSGRDDDWMIAEAACALNVAGIQLDWDAWDSPWKRSRMVLPTYPFQRTRCWLDPSDSVSGNSHLYSAKTNLGDAAVHPMLGRRVPTATALAMFDSDLSIKRVAFLADHAVQGSINLPAAGFLELALSAIDGELGESGGVLRDLNVMQGMFLSEDEPRRVQTVLKDNHEILVFSAESDDWKRHVHARWVSQGDGEQQAVEAVPEDWATVRDRLFDHQRADDFYDIMTDRQLRYGESFRMLSYLGRAPEEVIGEVQCVASVIEQANEYRLHPVVGDAIFQTFSGLVPLEADGGYSPFTYMPSSIGEFRLVRPVDAETVARGLTVYGRRTSSGAQPSPETVTGDMWLLDADGEVLANFGGVTCTRIGRAGGDSASESLRKATYDVGWEPITDELTNPMAALNGRAIALLTSENDLVAPLLTALKSAGASATVVDDVNDLSTVDAILDLRALSQDQSASTPEIAKGNCENLLATMQSVIRRSLLTRSSQHSVNGYYVLTKASQAASDNDSVVGFDQAVLWGMTRVARLELAELTPRLIDLPDSKDTASVVPVLLSAIAHSSDEFQVAIRDEQILAARLRHEHDDAPEKSSDSVSAATPLPDGPYRLRFGEAGRFDSLVYEATELSFPASGQVQVRVHAAGLNFSDVLKVMGLYPGITDPVVPLGIECSGVVTAVGDGVSEFAVGDEVMGVAPFSFASHVQTPAYTLVHRPESMDAVEAASIPIAFLTAWHGLIRLADLQEGERVLIHAGAGGVGLAAIQIAQSVGAEVFTTAGSPEKRDYLRSLGVKNVYNSRTLEFADQIRQETGGEGIDVVLNSLPGEAIPKSLKCLRAYGRFLEIGKTDIYQNRAVGLAPFQDNLSYHAIDLDRVLRQRPRVITALYDDLKTQFEAGHLTPAACTEFDATDIVGAFRYMAARKNIGKIVVRMPSVMNPNAGDDGTQGDAGRGAEARPMGTAVITGGTGAIGLRVAEHLLGHQHTHVALLSRRDPSPSVSDELERIGSTGNVVVLKGDVSDADSLNAALQTLPSSFPTITDVYHAAGVLDDGLMMDMTPEQLMRPMAAKVQGGWNLHQATANLPIRRFVLFSSIAGILGSPGQANYAAANSFLDSLAGHRRASGLPGTSVAWGPWADAGMASGDVQDANLKSRGLTPLQPAASVAHLESLVEDGATAVAVMDVDWSKMLQAPGATSPFTRELAGDDGSRGTDASVVDHSFLDQLRPLGGEEHDQAVQNYFATELARLMGWDVSQINMVQPLSELGMDSLIAMELKNNLEQRLDISIPMAALLESPSIESLVASVSTSLPRSDEREPKWESQGGGDGQYQPLLAMCEGSSESKSGETWLCVHTLGGSLTCYADIIARAASDQRILGLIGKGADGVLDPPDQLDDMMDEYVEAIVAGTDTSRLHLIGWSSGGLFAMDLARRLRQQARFTEADSMRMTMIDTPVPSIYRDVDTNDPITFLVDFIRFSNVFKRSDMRVTEAQLRSLDDPNEMWNLFLSEAKRNRLMLPNASIDYVRRLVATCRCHVEFLQRMKVTCPCPMRLIHSNDPTALAQASDVELTPDLGWQPLIEREPSKFDMDMTTINADHFTMLMGDHADELIGLLSRPDHDDT